MNTGVFRGRVECNERTTTINTTETNDTADKTRCRAVENQTFYSLTFLPLVKHTHVTRGLTTTRQAREECSSNEERTDACSSRDFSSVPIHRRRKENSQTGAQAETFPQSLNVCVETRTSNTWASRDFSSVPNHLRRNENFEHVGKARLFLSP